MPPKELIPSEVGREYCRMFPDSPTLTLAKNMYSKNKEVFSDVEHARTVIRRIRGQSGQKKIQEMKDKSLIKPLTYQYNPFKLPESQTVKANVFTLPTSIKKVLFLTDIHIPFHDNQAIEAAVAYGKKENVDCVWINGDLCDFYQLSFHEKDPRKVSIVSELEACRTFFAYLRNEFPLATIYYIPGNHEIRLERYLKIKAPELLDVPEFQLDVFLKVREHDIIFIPFGSKVYFGKLLVEHGDKMKGTGGVNPARTLALKFKRHTICGHFHRTSEAIQKVYDGESYVTYSVGALCDLEPFYFPVNDHNHGTAIIEMLPGGEFIVSNKKISNGKVY